MTQSHRRFGELLEEGIKRVHIAQKKSIGYILDEFGYALREDGSKGRYALGHWYYKKRIPAEMQDVEKLADLIVQNGDLDREWLENFLESAGHPNPGQLADQYFGSVSRMEPVAPPVAAATEVPTPPLQKAPTSPRPFPQGIIAIGGLALALLVGGIWAASTLFLNPLRPTQTADQTTADPTEPAQPSSLPATATAPARDAFDGVCPAVSSSPSFKYTGPDSVQAYLNMGGDPTRLAPLRSARGDLDGDKRPVLIVNLPDENGSWWQVLDCHGGVYYPVFETSYPENYQLEQVTDLTGDGRAEILVSLPVISREQPALVYNLWNLRGDKITVLNQSDSIIPKGQFISRDAGEWSLAMFNPQVEIQDENNDGIQELRIRSGLSSGQATCKTVFEREFTDRWVWDGSAYQISERTYTKPAYRFQAAMDADIAFAFHRYDQALEGYQDVAFSKDLHPRNWLPDSLAHCASLEIEDLPGDFDPAVEFAQLEGYARWRILLIHIIQKHPDAAETIYNSLQSQFPAGKAGHSYTAIASAFWAAYQSKPEIAAACAQAIEAAKKESLYPGHRAEGICTNEK